MKSSLGYKQKIGRTGEAIACNYLESLGYKVLATNWFSRFGEIDLIAERDRTVIIVEVKTRTNELTGSPLEAITVAKVKRLQRLSRIWLEQHKNFKNRPLRIDAIGITLFPSQEPKIVHIEGIS